MKIPKNVIPFKVESGFWEPSIFNKIETKVLQLLKVTDEYKKEFARLLIANSFETNGRLICNFEAFYSIARLLFSLNEKTTIGDWNVVSQTVQNNPRIIFTALDLECTEWYSEKQFFLFNVNGISAHFAADLASLGLSATKLNKKISIQQSVETPQLQLQ